MSWIKTDGAAADATTLSIMTQHNDTQHNDTQHNI